MVSVPTRQRGQYRVFIVRPAGDFTPSNWQQKPHRFTIVERLETTDRLGRADALRWLHNDRSLSGDVDTWAVVLKPQRSKGGAR